jgi:hypothetical protein
MTTDKREKRDIDTFFSCIACPICSSGFPFRPSSFLFFFIFYVGRVESKDLTQSVRTDINDKVLLSRSECRLIDVKGES